MDRPTLEEQIRVSKMTEEELVKALLPHTPFERVSFWLHSHCPFVWRVVRWNWFNIWTEEKGFMKFARHWFKEWGRNE